MRLVAEVSVPAAILDVWEAMLLCEGIDYDREGFPEYSCVWCQTAKFPDGMEIDVKVCTDSRKDADAWSEAVLFDEKGCEVCHTEVCDSLRGEWTLEFEDEDGTRRVYVADVKDFKYVDPYKRIVGEKKEYNYDPEEIEESEERGDYLRAKIRQSIRIYQDLSKKMSTQEI